MTRSCNYCITTVCLKDLPQLCGTGLAPVHAVGDQFNDGGVDNMDSSFETVLWEVCPGRAEKSDDSIVRGLPKIVFQPDWPFGFCWLVRVHFG